MGEDGYGWGGCSDGGGGGGEGGGGVGDAGEGWAYRRVLPSGEGCALVVDQSARVRGFTLARMKWMTDSSGVPGPKTWATPCCLRWGMSCSGMVPPRTRSISCSWDSRRSAVMRGTMAL